MKKYLTALAAASTMLFLPNTTLAADNVALSLDDAIALALKNNRIIEQSAEDREAARWNLSAVRRSSGPVLNWSASFNHIGGRYYRRQFRTPRDNAKAQSDFDAFYYNYDNGFNLKLFPNYNYENMNLFTLRYNLYTGGRAENQRDSARYGLNVADLSLENSRQLVKYRAAAAYYQVLRNASLVNVQEQAVELLEEHLRNVQIQYEVGTVAKSDVLATSVQLANVQQALTSAQGNYQTAVAQLNNVLGLPIDTQIATTSEIKFTNYQLTEAQCQEYAVSHRPDGRAAAYAVKQAGAATRAAKSGYRPTVTAVATGRLTGESLFQSNHVGEQWSVGFELNWNIFDNGVTSAQVHESQAQERKAQSQAKQQLEAIELEVRSAYIALKTAEKNIQTTAAAVAKAEEEFAIAQVRYVEGVDTNLNVMNAQEKVVETRNNYYTALYNYNNSRAQLEKAMGVPVLIDALLYVEAEQSGKSSKKSLEAAQISDGNYYFPSPAENLKPFDNSNP